MYQLAVFSNADVPDFLSSNDTALGDLVDNALMVL